jgi:hypothetical protein
MSESMPPLAVEKVEETRVEKAPAFGPLDWLSLLVAGNTAVFLLGFSLVAGHRFGSMFDDFGGKVPFVTSLVVRWYVPTAAGLLVAGALVYGLRGAPSRRRVTLAGAALAGLLAAAICVYGLYAPIWELAGKIKA